MRSFPVAQPKAVGDGPARPWPCLQASPGQAAAFPLSSIRTVTVGPGVPPDLLTLSLRKALAGCDRRWGIPPRPENSGPCGREGKLGAAARGRKVRGCRAGVQGRQGGGSAPVARATPPEYFGPSDGGGARGGKGVTCCPEVSLVGRRAARIRRSCVPWERAWVMACRVRKKALRWHADPRARGDSGGPGVGRVGWMHSTAAGSVRPWWIASTLRNVLPR